MLSLSRIFVVKWGVCGQAHVPGGSHRKTRVALLAVFHTERAWVQTAVLQAGATGSNPLGLRFIPLNRLIPEPTIRLFAAPGFPLSFQPSGGKTLVRKFSLRSYVSTAKRRCRSEHLTGNSVTDLETH